MSAAADPTLRRKIAKAKAVVSIFETNRPLGDPAALAVLNDGAGFSAGMHQATHGSGSLFKVVKRYVELATVAEAADRLKAYLPALGDTKPASRQRLVREHGEDFRKWWKIAARTDPAMRAAQEQVFDVNYMKPALAAWRALGWTSALGLTACYDAHIQGGWAACVAAARRGTAEHEQLANYLARREQFLLGLPKSSQKASAYRPRELREELRRGNLGLEPPFTMHGTRVDESVLDILEAENVNVKEAAARRADVIADPEVDVDMRPADAEDADIRPMPDEVSAAAGLPADSQPATPAPAEPPTPPTPAPAPAPTPVPGGGPDDAPVQVPPVVIAEPQGGVLDHLKGLQAKLDAAQEIAAAAGRRAFTLKAWYAQLLYFGSLVVGATVTFVTRLGDWIAAHPDIVRLIIWAVASLGLTVAVYTVTKTWLTHKREEADRKERCEREKLLLEEQRRREERAFELTKLQLQGAQDPNKINAVVAPPSVVVEAGAA